MPLKQKRQPARVGVLFKAFLVARGGIEPPTQGFSRLLSRLNGRISFQVGTMESNEKTWKKFIAGAGGHQPLYAFFRLPEGVVIPALVTTLRSLSG
jgi:hypothetical protein